MMLPDPIEQMENSAERRYYEAISHDDKLPLCKGCRNDFYNQDGNSQTGRCWSLPDAQVVERFRIGWWTQPTQPGAYRKVVTLSCHAATGQYAQHVEMPSCFPGYGEVLKSEPFDARKP